MNEKLGKLNITIDPRMELLAIVQYFSKYADRFYGLVTRERDIYTDRVMDYFQQYKNHAIINLFDDMSLNGFNFDAPPASILYLSNPPLLKEKFPFDEYVIRRAGGREKLENFIDLLRDFSEKTQFISFFEDNNNQIFYKQVISSVMQKINNLDYISILEDYYGYGKGSYNIILVPLFSNGNYGHQIKDNEGQEHIYAILNASHVEDRITKELLINLLWHEFSHSYINPITEENWKQVSQYNKMFDPIKETMDKLAYSTWETCVNEHIVRAITVRLICLHIDSDEGKTLLEDEVKNGFIYIKELCKLLEHYENHRNIYPTFKEFYREIIKFFSEIYMHD
ncbi:protein of unknown function [Caldanaerobius fijiensis DSM 17918]|uniref:DUF4932 domain-containing protein n=1 Tax=Caldanaerobius fijiensis DSM 17918 TaxID=1121256 RepID=A0A1M4ZIJ6_9THEO|nr:DUF4932 domain-containing protein [Caldanaerobius fijiensis]SHF17396.1 protein of unknown function [Caldanaerobius fijiensis DSM 17918]